MKSKKFTVLMLFAVGCCILAVLLVRGLGSRPARYKHESSRDSYSTWSMYELDTAAAQLMADRLHREMAFIDDESLRTKDVEQATGQIHSIVVRAPTGKTPDWWKVPELDGHSTENMLWYKSYPSGVAQGCYTIYDSAHRQLWVYQYAAQYDTLWSRGSKPKVRPKE